ncbi:hypothetical protein GCM10022198_05880 [Klugiella xanthotipulae]
MSNAAPDCRDKYYLSHKKDYEDGQRVVVEESKRNYRRVPPINDESQDAATHTSDRAGTRTGHPQALSRPLARGKVTKILRGIHGVGHPFSLRDRTIRNMPETFG